MNKPLLLIGTIVLSAMAYFYTGDMTKVYDNKIKEQHKSVMDYSAWLSQYEMLAGAEAKFAKTYTSAKGINDIATLLDRFKLPTNLFYVKDDVVVSDLKYLKSGEQALGLAKVCIAQGSAFTIKASTMTELKTGLTELISRPDIFYDRFTFGVDGKEIPTARFDNLCILLRD